ncbi:MAG: hypothetical protein R8G66_33410 [Cytophagales bacterium]|nr:hypothetical protein [Cytophagales bacterium]
MREIPVLSKEQKLDLSISKLFEDFPEETHEYLNAVREGISQSGDNDGTVRGLIFSHLKSGKKPIGEDKILIDNIPNIKPQVSMPDDSHFSECEKKWETFLVEAILAVFSVAGMKSKLKGDGTARLAAQFGKENLLGLETAWYRMADKEASWWSKAKALFGFTGGCLNLISFKAIIHAIGKDLSTWDKIEDIATVIFQMMAWLGSDWVAAAGELLLTTEQLLSADSSFSKAHNYCSLEEFFHDMMTTETKEGLYIDPHQPHTPSVVEFNGNVCLFYNDPKTAKIVYKFSTMAAIAALVHQREVIDANGGKSSGNNNLHSWSQPVGIPEGSKVTGSPTAAVLLDTIYVFYQKQGDPMQYIYYVSTKDLDNWTSEQKIELKIEDNHYTAQSITSPGVCTLNDELHVYFPGINENLIWDSVFDGTTWNKPYLLNGNVSTSTTPWGSLINGSLTVSYRGAGANEYIYNTTNDDGWQDPERLDTSITTSASPARSDTENHAYYYRGTGTAKEIWIANGGGTGHHCVGSPVILGIYCFYCVSPGIFNVFQIER